MAEISELGHLKNRHFNPPPSNISKDGVVKAFAKPVESSKETTEYQDGSKYTGTIINGKKEGLGTYEAGGDILMGTFKDDLLQGNGTLKKNGYIFNGNFTNSRLDGEVTITKNNNTEFELKAQFKDGSPQLDQDVTIKDKNGIFKGIAGPINLLVEGGFDGKGTYTYKDGSVFIGMVWKGKPDNGTMTLQNNEIKNYLEGKIINNQ